LYRKADPIGQYPGRDFYQQFLKGLRTELRTAVRMAATTNVQDALEKAKAAEAAYSGDGPLGGYSLMSKNEDELKKELRELKELLTQRPNKKTSEQCDLCYKSGHSARECPSSSIRKVNAKCWICGRSGHVKYNCPLNKDESQPVKECYRCGEKGHWAKECQLGEPPKQILQRRVQQPGPIKRVFVAHTNELDPEDQQQIYTYYQPTVQNISSPPTVPHQPVKEQQSQIDTLGMLAKAVTELTNKVSNLKG
jgi:hypothetical protein